MLYAVIDDGKSKVTYMQSFCVEVPKNESNVSKYLANKFGEGLVHPLNGIPYYIEASSWCFNGRTEGDEYEAIDKNGNIIFSILIENRE